MKTIRQGEGSQRTITHRCTLAYTQSSMLNEPESIYMISRIWSLLSRLCWRQQIETRIVTAERVGRQGFGSGGERFNGFLLPHVHHVTSMCVVEPVNTSIRLLNEKPMCTCAGAFCEHWA